MNQQKKIKIQIQPQNIPNLNSITFQFTQQESLLKQAIQFILDQNEEIDQQNIICYSKQKKRVIYEQETVDSIIDLDEKPEIELYLFNDILNRLASKQEQKIEIINQQSNNDSKTQNTKIEMTALNKQIEELLQERNEFREKCSLLEEKLRNLKKQQQEKPNFQNDLQNSTNLESYRLKLELEQSIKSTTQLKDIKQKQEKLLEELEKKLNQKQDQLTQEIQKNTSLQQANINALRDQQILEGKFQNLREELKKTNYQQEKLQKEVDQKSKILQDTQVILDQFKQSTHSKDELIIVRNNIISEKEKKINQLSEEIILLKKDKEKLQSDYTSLTVDNQEKLIKLKQLEKVDNNLKFISYFIENNPFKQLNDLFITPIDAMYRKKLNPYEFEKQQNANTNICDATVKKLSIESGQNVLQWLQFKSDKSINEFIKKNPQKMLKVLKSINKDGQGTKSKCFLMQIQQIYHNDKSLEKKVFALKIIDGHEGITKEEHAIFLAYQIIVAQVLAECFQQKITKPPFKFEFQLPHLFTIGDNIYLGQELLNQDYKSFQQNVDNSIIKLFNAFSQFTSDFTSGALIVTNFKGGQLVGDKYILFEPIIHTPGGIFGPEDQGQIGFDLVLQSLRENPELNGQEYLKGLNYNI
ncbi:unnamed protein product [Paramecium pentaurelia]|uniref:Uncharacterized protein n=1 Tax=Paramecium pentaurelia TaxID=43138 RepID=A0A8S1W0G2_9CILI|nr:unnamed protein product [Paramecium pentaurelia]